MIDARVRELLRERAGLVAEALGESAVLSILERRARASGLALAGYLARLAHDPAEGSALVEDVLVPETWFYRDLAPFELLTSLCSQGRWGSPVRALSFPCSSGEEAYSIAIALLEGGAQPSVEGWDLSTRALARARAASYTAFSLRGAPPWLRERYLVASGDELAVRPEVASLVRLRQANILDLDPRGGGATFDVVFCRNLFIYLERPARERALVALRSLLSPSGLLVLGHADGLPDPTCGLRPFGPPGAFAFEAAPPSAPRPAPAAAVQAQAARSALPAASSPGASSPGASRPRGPAPLRAPPRAAAGPSLLTPQPARPAALQPARPAAPRPPALAPLDEARALADRGELAAARAVCEREASRAPLLPGAHRLLGVILVAQGDPRGAEGALRRALYLDPRDAEALGQMAALCERLGRPAEAASFRRRLLALGGER